MGSKQYKIRRYKNIYGRRSGALKAVLIVAAIALCCFLGWAIYEPVYNMLVGDKEEEISSSEEVSEVSSEISDTSIEEPKEEIQKPVPEKEEVKEEAASGEPSSQEESKEEREEEASASVPEVLDVSNEGGVFLPRAILNDPAQLDAFLKNLKEKGCTSVVVEAKNAIGEVLYLSENQTAIDSQAIVGDAFDASKVSRHIKDAGLIPVAKLHGFRDGLAAMANNDLAVKYFDTSYIWLDNSADLGGRGWLNPYNDEAVNYIGSLASELITKGFKEIIVDSVHYPLGVGRDKIGFGDVSQDKLTALSDSMKKIENMVTAKGGRVSFVLNPGDYEEDSSMVYGGDILTNKEYSYALTASVDNITSMESTLHKINSMGKEADIILLSYTYDGSQATKDKLLLILEELKKSDVGSIYLFNPQGIY